MQKKEHFRQIFPLTNLPELEERVLRYWKENKIFEKSIEGQPSDKPWTFLDGPPFVTGMPHYGHIVGSILKDVFPRFWTMKGYRVRRVWGWDGHGLAIENKVEVKLGLKRKKDIEEKVGVKEFIKDCYSYVKDVSGEWEWYIDHIARWVDFKNAYKTWDAPYMESVMWVFKQMYDRGHIYKGLRVSLYCPHCSTPISNFEVAMDPDNYKEITEQAPVFKYQLNDDLRSTSSLFDARSVLNPEDKPDTYLLAWSTTPWNKIATPALAVNPKLRYVKVKQGNECYILAKNTIGMLADEPHEVIEEFLGEKLVGLGFKPHYTFYSVDPGKRAFIVIPGDFVSEEEGTGIVTIAAYGEEDLAAMQKENIQIVLHVDDEGKLTHDVPQWGGMYYLDVDPLVIEDLSKRGLIYRTDAYTHTVPTCWRCHTRLFYAPQDAWYVDIQKLKPKLRETNEAVNWFPAHFKEGRYLNSLEAAPDWCISRSRYWGSPVPVWECACGERFVPGSIAELEKESGMKISNLHKPDIDAITVPCRNCGNAARRVPEVLDSWIEAGSASFAERHFPFDQTAKLEEFFPPDFIVEYTGQIRAWFYVLHVIAAALRDSYAFKNVLVTGVILGTDGRKMSKNYGNYPDPKELLQKYGGDALRLYLLSSSVVYGEDIRISEEEYRNQTRRFLLFVWNVYNFFATYANVDGWEPKDLDGTEKLAVLDRWILARLSETVAAVTKSLERYNTVSATEVLEKFTLDLSQWYLRRSRERVGPASSNESDRNLCYQALRHVLIEFSKVFAPFAPFMSEAIYKNITGGESVHLQTWPRTDNSQLTTGDEHILQQMRVVRKICEMGHAERERLGIRVRQPLQKLKVKNQKSKIAEECIQLIKDELNVKEIVFEEGEGELSVALDAEITPELRVEGEARELVRKVQDLRKLANCRMDDKIRLQLPEEYKSLPKDLLDLVQRETLSEEIVWGEKLEILKN